MRGIMHITCSRDVKNSHSAGLRSIPRLQRSSHLELYRFTREKDRLVKEIHALDKRKTSANRQLDDINKRIEDLQKEMHTEPLPKGAEQAAGLIKTLEINY